MVKNDQAYSSLFKFIQAYGATFCAYKNFSLDRLFVRTNRIVLRENFKAIRRVLKLLQFQNKNFKIKWHVGSGQADVI